MQLLNFFLQMFHYEIFDTAILYETFFFYFNNASNIFVILFLEQALLAQFYAEKSHIRLTIYNKISTSSIMKNEFLHLQFHLQSSKIAIVL